MHCASGVVTSAGENISIDVPIALLLPEALFCKKRCVKLRHEFSSDSETDVFEAWDKMWDERSSSEVDEAGRPVVWWLTDATRTMEHAIGSDTTWQDLGAETLSANARKKYRG